MNIVQIADKVLDSLNAFLEFVMGVLMVILVGIVFQEVIRRYIFNDPTAWASESCRFLLMWLTFTGASIVTRLSTHLSMGFTIHRFVNKKLSKIIKIFISGVGAIVMIFVTYYSAKITLLAGYRAAPMTGMPMYIPWSALPINGAIMSVYMIAETVKVLFTKSEDINVGDAVEVPA